MERLIQGMAPGAGISEMSPKAVAAYGLDAAGYHFENGTEDDCIGRLVSAASERRWVVRPLWRPQAPHRRFRLRHLQDPKAILGATEVLRESERLIGEAALADLAPLYIGNPAMDILDEAVRRRNSTGYTDYASPVSLSKCSRHPVQKL